MWVFSLVNWAWVTKVKLIYETYETFKCVYFTTLENGKGRTMLDESWRMYIYVQRTELYTRAKVNWFLSITIGLRNQFRKQYWKILQKHCITKSVKYPPLLYITLCFKVYWKCTLKINSDQGLVKGAKLCLNPYFFDWLEKWVTGCRSTLSMSKIKVRISETKYRSFYKTLLRSI